MRNLRNQVGHLRNPLCLIRGINAAQRRGQIAIGFLTVIALALVLVTMTVNVGQMAQVRTETSNAADAGALAGASWIASGMNEAALVANKVTEAKVLVQTIYLVPFCPGAEQTSYAEQLWYSLEEHPYAFDPVYAAPGHWRRGPANYFKEVADDAMWAAWYTGSREWFTSVVNNLMIKYPTGSGTVCDSDNFGACLGQYTNFGPVAHHIEDTQQALYELGAGSGVEYLPITWNNTLPFDDTMNLTHNAPFHVEFPERAPALQLAPEAAAYSQYEKAHAITVPGVPNPVFTCELEGWGIRTGYSGPNDPDALFVLMPESLLDYSVNPLAMVTETLTLPGIPVPGLGVTYLRKGWDVEWLDGRPAELDRLSGSSPYVPSLEHLDEVSQAVNGRPALGTCLTEDGDPQYVCGILPKSTPRTINVNPVGFQGGTGSVSVAVGHKVETATGTTDLFHSYAPLPNLAPRFPAVASKAQAKYSPPTLPLVTNDDAGEANLENKW